MLGMPVVTTFKGKGAFPENHPLSMGPIGMHGHAEANKIMVEADCVHQQWEHGSLIVLLEQWKTLKNDLK